MEIINVTDLESRTHAFPARDMHLLGQYYLRHIHAAKLSIGLQTTTVGKPLVL
jgi:hypothetical protein